MAADTSTLALPDYSGGIVATPHGGAPDVYASKGCYRDASTDVPLFAKVAKIGGSQQDAVVTDALHSAYITYIAERYDLEVRSRSTISKSHVPVVRLHDAYFATDQGVWKRSPFRTDHIATVYRCAQCERSDVASSMRDLVDFLKWASLRYGFLHNDLHSGNVVYDVPTSTFHINNYGLVSFDRWFVRQAYDRIMKHIDLPSVTLKNYEPSPYGGLPERHEDRVGAEGDEFRYIPDLMTLAMSVYTRMSVHTAGRSDLDGLFVRDDALSVLFGDVTETVPSSLRRVVSNGTFFGQLAEGLLAYKLFTEALPISGMVYEDCFDQYVWQSRGKFAMQKFLQSSRWRKAVVKLYRNMAPVPGTGTESVADDEALYIGGDAAVDDVESLIVASVAHVFPTSLNQAYAISQTERGSIGASVVQESKTDDLSLQETWQHAEEAEAAEAQAETTGTVTEADAETTGVVTEPKAEITIPATDLTEWDTEPAEVQYDPPSDSETLYEQENNDVPQESEEPTAGTSNQTYNEDHNDMTGGAAPSTVIPLLSLTLIVALMGGMR